MKKNALFALSGLLFFSCQEKKSELATAHTQAMPNFNIEALTKFWEVVDVLKNDNNLNDSLWNSYYELPGNKRYMERNRGEAQALQHRGFLELVFRPSMQDSLTGVIEEGTYNNSDLFLSLKYIKDNERVIREYSSTLDSPEYMTASLELAKKYLPQDSYEPIPENLTIYMQAITYDAAVQDSSMYFGLACIYDFDKIQPGTVAAHELHHVLRKNREIANTLTVRDSASFYLVNKVNNEGSADLIDKGLVIDPENNTLMGPLFKQMLMGDVEATIKKIDSALVLNSKSKEEFVTKKEFNVMLKYLSGHVPGFYMANVIERNGLKQELIDGCGNPFNIFYLYDRAAEKDTANVFRFSPETMEYLQQLEKNAFNEAASKA